MGVCSTQLQALIELAIPDPDDRVGPRVLWEITSHCQTSNDELVRSLCDQLKALTLKSIPGEDMQAYSIAANKILKQIRSHCSQGGTLSDLTKLVCKGVAGCTDPQLSNKATEFAIMKTPPPAEDVLNQLNELYMTLADHGLYVPGKSAPAASAFQVLEKRMNEVSSTLGHLVQKQDASGRGGGGRGGGSGRGGRGGGPGRGTPSTSRDKSNDTCTNCQQKGHWANDPVCPKFQECQAHLDERNRQSSCPGRSGQQGRGSLTDCDKRILQLIKGWNLPVNVDENYTKELTLDNEVVAKYCHKCGKFK